MNTIIKWLKLNDTVMNINKRNVDFIYAWNSRRYFEFANDKSLTKQMLEKAGIPVPETYTLIEGMGQIDEKWSIIRRRSGFAIKPSRGSGGSGILVLDKKNDRWYTASGHHWEERQIKSRIADIIFGNYSFGLSDKALVEERVQPDEFFSKIFKQGICDIRVIVFQARPVMAMCRIPTRKSDGKANLHQGALGIAVDARNGQLGYGYDYRSYMENHPDSGCRFYGLTIPYWKQIIEMCIHAGESLPLKYLGVDIVLDLVKGPLVMEVNLRPGLEIQNVNRKGLMKCL